MTLRALNQAQSAYVVFTLSARFFTEFLPAAGRSVTVKLYLKNMVNIFRSTTGVEKVWLQLAVDNECYLRVLQECEYGVQKKFDLAFEEVSSMNAVYSKENCATRIGVEPKLLLESLKNFQTNVELNLISQQQGLTIKNAVEDGSWGPDTDLLKDGQTRTEIKLHADELVSYHVDPRFAAAGISISFLQKEFRALLQLVHEIEHRIDMYIEAGGKPIIFGSAPRRDARASPLHCCRVRNVACQGDGRAPPLAPCAHRWQLLPRVLRRALLLHHCGVWRCVPRGF